MKIYCFIFFLIICIIAQEDLGTGTDCTKQKNGDKCVRDDLVDDMVLSVEGFCMNGVCNSDLPCGNYGEKAIEGRCCANSEMETNGICSSACENGLDCVDPFHCINGHCRKLQPGVSCGVCGKLPINGKCCENGIVDNVKKTGLCICNIPKCIYTKDCPNYNHSTCCKGQCEPRNQNACDGYRNYP